MKTKFLDGIIAFHRKDGVTFEIARIVKNSQPFLVEKRYYTYKYNSDHVDTAIVRFLSVQVILWRRRVYLARKRLKEEENEISSSGK